MEKRMTYSKNALDMTKKFEGCRLKAYQDSGGVWTIAYGHTRGVYPGMSINLSAAEKYLCDDMQEAADSVNELVKPDLSQNEFDALVDFVFNVGAERFRRSTMLGFINDRHFYLASLEFERWDMAGGKVVAGLLARRKVEAQVFNEV